MKIGVNPRSLLETFFPGEYSRREILPGEEEKTLWAAAGAGSATWYEVPDDRRWGSWSTLLFVDEAHASQYDGVLEQLRQGNRLPPNTACLALTGRDFHGQQKRPWEARRGNLHLTVSLTPDRPAREIGHGFTLLPAVAVVRVIRNLSGGAVAAGIKWVNDIVVEGRKVGGVLAATQVQRELIRDVVLGLGINIGETPPVEPTPFVPAAACLNDFHGTFHLTTLLPALLTEIRDLYDILLTDGSRPLLEAYREYAVVVGQTVRIWQDSEGSLPENLRKTPPIAQGVVSAIADDLSLIIEGRRKSIPRGRLAEEGICRKFGL
jgi:biotin-[acetyl-CoA-carboxylase] ligase BirA-like protein